MKLEKKLKIKIIDFINSNNSKFHRKSIPCFYIISKLDEDKRVIYKSIQCLVHEGILEKECFSICHICLTDNLLLSENKDIKCRHCGEYYYSDEIDERYKLTQNTKPVRGS